MAYKKVHPFPSFPTTMRDKVLELFFSSFLVKLVLAFVKGAGVSRVINGEAVAVAPGKLVYASANSIVMLASSGDGACGVVNELNNVAAGAKMNLKSVGEFDVYVDAPGANPGDCLWASALTPGNFSVVPVLDVLPGAQVIDNSAYAETGKCKVELLLPMCAERPVG